MNRLAAATVLAAASLSIAAPALADGPDTTVRHWRLPAGQDGSNWKASWPQKVWSNNRIPECKPYTVQVDTYKWATDEEKRIVDRLNDDGWLVLVNGVPEDSAVYITHHYETVPAKDCSGGTPSPTTTTVPTTTTTTSSTTSTTAPPTSSTTSSTSSTSSTTTSTTSTTSSPSTTSSSSTTSSTPPPSTSTAPPSTSASTPSTAPPPTSSQRSPVIGTPELARTGLNGLGTAVVIGLVLLMLGLGAFAYAYAITKGSNRGRHQ